MREYPDAPVAGVGAVVWKGDQVLLVRRAHPPARDTWSLPGGLQILGETVQEAVAREISEETGIVIRILDIADVIDFMERDETGRLRYHYTIIDMVAEWRAGEAVAGDDAADVVWADRERFSELALTPDVVRVIDIAAAKRRARGQK